MLYDHQAKDALRTKEFADPGTVSPSPNSATVSFSVPMEMTRKTAQVCFLFFVYFLYHSLQFSVRIASLPYALREMQALTSLIVRSKRPKPLALFICGQRSVQDWNVDELDMFVLFSVSKLQGGLANPLLSTILWALSPSSGLQSTGKVDGGPAKFSDSVWPWICDYESADLLMNPAFNIQNIQKLSKIHSQIGVSNTFSEIPSFLVILPV